MGGRFLCLPTFLPLVVARFPAFFALRLPARDGRPLYSGMVLGFLMCFLALSFIPPPAFLSRDGAMADSRDGLTPGKRNERRRSRSLRARPLALVTCHLSPLPLLNGNGKEKTFSSELLRIFSSILSTK